MSARKSWAGLFLIGLLAYLMSLAIQFPARALWSLAEAPLSEIPALEISQPSGTIWKGVIARLNYRDLQLRDLQWSWNPMDLLSGRLGYDLQFDHVDGQGHAEIGFGFEDVRVRDLRLDLPASVLADAIETLPARLDGRLMISAPLTRWDYRGQPLDAEATVGWFDAAAGLGTLMAIGDLRAEISTPEPSRLAAVLSDQGGPVQLDAEADWHLNGRYALSGWVAARESASRELQESLALLGQPAADGRYRLQWSGRL